MNDYFISYVIPCYNCDSTIFDTVMSIKESHENAMNLQKKKSLWEKIQVVLVNDGSTDYTADVVNEIGSEYPNMKILHLEKNSGKGAARNFGNSNADSDIIAVLDSDDINVNHEESNITYDRSVFIRETFDKYKDLDVFYSSFVSIHTYNNSVYEKISEPININLLKTTGEWGIGHSTMAYRKKVILDNPYSESIYTDDWGMIWNLFTKNYKFINSKKIFVGYRITLECIEKESSPEKQKKIFEKKKKIMDEYFDKDKN